jgi:hypothetical protein
VLTILGFLFEVIGHGPSTPDRLTSVIMIVVAAVLGFAAIAPGTRLRGLNRRTDPGVPIGSAGRLILLVVSAIILADGLHGLLQ